MAQGQSWHIPKASQTWSKHDRMALRRSAGMDGGSEVTHPIKKATGKVASFIKRLKNLNFNSEQEVIEGYKYDQDLAYDELMHRHKRFNYYFDVFELEEPLFLEEFNKKQKEQYGLIWKLVDLEGGRYE